MIWLKCSVGTQSPTCLLPLAATEIISDLGAPKSTIQNLWALLREGQLSLCQETCYLILTGKPVSSLLPYFLQLALSQEASQSWPWKNSTAKGMGGCAFNAVLTSLWPERCYDGGLSYFPPYTLVSSMNM